MVLRTTVVFNSLLSNISAVHAFGYSLCVLQMRAYSLNVDKS